MSTINRNRKEHRLTGICCVTQPKLPEVVEAPTLHSTVVEQRTRVMLASTNRCHLHTRPKIKIDRRNIDIICVTQPELPEAVVTPTLHSTVVEQRTRVMGASTNRCRTSNTLKNRKVRRNIDIYCVTQPELPVGVVTPTLHSTVAEQRTRVMHASTNRCRTSNTLKNRKVRRLIDIICVTQPELPGAVEAPTLHSTRRQQRTRVRVASGNLWSNWHVK